MGGSMAGSTGEISTAAFPAVSHPTTGLRVCVIGTGGLSHSIGESTMGWIDEEFDQTCIKHFEDGEDGRLAAFLTQALPRTGNGAHEIRDWVIAHAAAGSTTSPCGTMDATSCMTDLRCPIDVTITA